MTIRLDARESYYPRWLLTVNFLVADRIIFQFWSLLIYILRDMEHFFDRCRALFSKQPSTGTYLFDK
jgi:hypothetical protein